ncbi:FtsX-like permease family protein [Nocardiopsis ganjiahuensis]|uniref:FtsX-like permease family protein n=1 Tax=Nocardiopsis ganjiahuensis TaxID=239984 RepID=UPI00034A12E1|nr:FtsX-like permease family protein [Nocardiopsis ganjiahuensis]
MITLVLRGVAARAGSLLVAVLTVAAGAGLAVATVALQGSVEHVAATGGNAAWRLADAGVVVVAVPEDGALAETPSAEPARLDHDSVEELAGIAGVERVGVEAPFPVHVVGPEETLGGRTDRSWGHSVELAEAEGLVPASGRFPRASGEVAVDARTAADAGLEPGSTARLLTPEGIESALVTGVFEQEANPARAVVLPSEEAAAHGGAPVLAALHLNGERSPDRVAEEVGERIPGVRALTGTERGEALVLDRTDRELSSGMGRFLATVSGFASALAVIMLLNLTALAVRRRSHEFALIRLAGAGPGTVRGLVLGEAVVLGGVAAALSWAVGALLALLLAWLFGSMGVLPSGFALRIGWSAPAVGGVLALAVAVAAAWGPARTAARITPMEAVRVAAPGPERGRGVRTVLGALVSCGAVALLMGAWALSGTRSGVLAAFAGAMALVFGAALLTPLLARVSLALVRPLVRHRVVPFLTERDARANQGRVAGVLTPLLVLTAVSFLLLFQGTTTARAHAHSQGELLAADLVVSGPEGVGVPEGAVRGLERVPGVAAVGGFRRTVISIGGVSAPAYLVEPETVTRFFGLESVEGSWREFGTDAVALHADTARRTGAKAGDVLELTGPDGVGFRARVAVLYEAGVGFPEALVPGEVLAPRMLDSTDSAVHVALATGADPVATAAAVREAVDAGPETRVLTGSDHLAEQAVMGEEDGWLLLLMVALLVGFTGMSAANTLVVSVAGRARDFALLRLAGASRSQVAGMVSVEALAVAAVGILVGGAVAASGLAVAGYALTGDTVVLGAPVGQCLAVAATVMVVGLVASLAPAVAALRAHPLRTGV